MKILFVSEYYPPLVMGGGEINLSIITKALVEQKAEVVVLTSFQKGLKKFEVVNGVLVYRRLATGKHPHSLFENLKRSIRLPRSITKEVKRLCRSQKFDLIHFVGGSLIAAPSLKKLKIPLVATIESYPALCPKGDRMYKGKEACNLVCSWNKFVTCQTSSPEIGKMKNTFLLKYNPLFLRYIYNHFTRLQSALKHCHLIAISDYLKQILKYHGLQSTIIPNAFEFSSTMAVNQKNNPPKILYLGSLTSFKGPQVLLKALKGLPYRCDLYGEGPLKDRLNRYIKENHLNARIHNPITTNINQLYSQYDLIVYPSLWPEPFGRISIEAIANGKPVLASRIGAQPELIKQDEFLFPPGDYQLLNKRIIELLNSKKITTLMSELIKDAKKNYSKEVVAKKLLSFYEKVSV